MVDRNFLFLGDEFLGEFLTVDVIFKLIAFYGNQISLENMTKISDFSDDAASAEMTKMPDYFWVKSEQLVWLFFDANDQQKQMSAVCNKKLTTIAPTF